MGRHSYDYDPERDAVGGVGEGTPDGAPSEPPPLVPTEAGDGTGAERGEWQSAGEQVL